MPLSSFIIIRLCEKKVKYFKKMSQDVSMQTRAYLAALNWAQEKLPVKYDDDFFIVIREIQERDALGANVAKAADQFTEAVLLAKFDYSYRANRAVAKHKRWVVKHLTLRQPFKQAILKSFWKLIMTL